MMKKKILCLLVCMLLAVTLFSCNNEPNKPEEAPPESAQELYDRIDEKMSALTSYKMDMSLDMTFFINGYKVKGETTGFSFADVKILENADFYTESTVKITAPELSLDQTQKSIDAYYGGNYFISHEQDDTVQKLYSPMTAEEATEYRSKNNLDTIDMIRDCTTKTFAKREDGMWELSCSGYTKATIEKFSEQMGMDNEALSADLMDMTLVLVADTDYLATQIKIDFTFEETKNMPVFSANLQFSQYNEAIAVPDTLKTEDYTRVDDIRLLDDIQDMLEKRGDSDSCKFTLNISESVLNSDEKQLSSYKEDNNVSFGESSEGYFYDIDAFIGKTHYDISYKHGNRIVETVSSSQDDAQTEQEARDWINSLINAANYDPIIVTNIEDKGDGVYRLTCGNLKTDAYESYFTSNGGKMTSANQTIAVTIKDGNIIKILSTVRAEGTVPTLGAISVISSSTIVFK